MTTISWILPSKGLSIKGNHKIQERGDEFSQLFNNRLFSPPCARHGAVYFRVTPFMVSLQVRRCERTPAGGSEISTALHVEMYLRELL